MSKRKAVTVGSVKKSTNEAPTSERPPAPKSQIAATELAMEGPLYLKYLGALSVLGAVASHHSRDLSSDDKYSIEAAMNDANVVLARRKAGIRFCKAGGGWAAFEHKEPEEDLTAKG